MIAVTAPLPFEIFGLSAQLARPDRWPLLPLLAFAALVVAWGIARRRRQVRELVATPALRQKVLSGGGTGVHLLAAGLSLGGLLLLCLALLQPQLGERDRTVRQMGIDLVVAIDASRSMLGRDILPSRLDRARLELGRLLDRLEGDRVGLVVFAGEAFVQCPLTSDYDAARLFLRAIDPMAMPTQGTALAEALLTARTMFRSAERGATTKAILLLTDGEDHEGEVEAATRLLAEEGIRVFALGIGSERGTPVPILGEDGRIEGYLKDASGQPVVSRLEEAQLRRIAEATGGGYVPARGSDIGMGEIFAELERLERSELDTRVAMQWVDVWQWLGFPGFALLLLGAVVPGAGRRR